MMDLKALVTRVLEGNVIVSDSGIRLHTPDGQGHYRALWTRDYHYQIDDAGELMPPGEIRDCLEYTFSHARPEDGWMPDRVDEHGIALYAAGSFDATGAGLANLDDNAFAVLSTEVYLRYVSDDEGKAFVNKWMDTLVRAMRATPVGENGLVYNDPEKPHSPYGFTDIICKTGYECFTSLLHWKACKVLASWGVKEFEASAKKIEQSFEATFFPDGRILPLAATIDCRKTDIWASCYALACDFPFSDERKNEMRKALVEQYDGIVQNGQLRHMPAGEYWDRFFCYTKADGTVQYINVEPGTYQNGAFYATPAKWLVMALYPYDKKLAERVVADLKVDFETGGCCECINGLDYRKLPDFVPSATAAYGAEKYLIAHRSEI